MAKINTKVISLVIVLVILVMAVLPLVGQALVEPVNLEVSFSGEDKGYSITGYIKMVYLFATAIVGGLAAVMIVIGAIQYSTAAGSPSGIASAKETIFSAIIGLVIVITAYLILGAFGTQFTNLKEPELDEVVVEDMGSEALPSSFEDRVKSCQEQGGAHMGSTMSRVYIEDECARYCGGDDMWDQSRSYYVDTTNHAAVCCFCKNEICPPGYHYRMLQGTKRACADVCANEGGVAEETDWCCKCNGASTQTCKIDDQDMCFYSEYSARNFCKQSFSPACSYERRETVKNGQTISIYCCVPP